MVVFDATTLLLLLSPTVPPPVDPTTHIPVEHAKERIDYLVKQLEQSRTKIIIPTPALSEILVRADSAGPTYLDRLNSSAAFRIVPFDQRAAVEVAAMTRDAMATGNKRGGAQGRGRRSNMIVKSSPLRRLRVLISYTRMMRTCEDLPFRMA